MATGIVTLKIGSLTISPLRRLPSSKYTAAPVRQRVLQRAESGRAFVFNTYTKYTVTITGLAQTLFEDLRYLYEQDSALDLYSIANRKEVIIPTGLTITYLTSRRVRLDEGAVTPKVEWPEGSVLASSTYSIVNGTTNATITFGSVLPAGTNAVIRFYPILTGYINTMTDDYDWVLDESSWNISFEEA